MESIIENFRAIDALIASVKEACCDGGMHLSSHQREGRNIELMILLKREILNKNLLGLSLILMYIQGSAARDSIYNDYEKDNIEVLRAAMLIEPDIKTNDDKELHKIMISLISDAIQNLIEQSHNIDSLLSLVNNQYDAENKRRKYDTDSD